MKSLESSIRLRVVGRREDMRDAKATEEGVNLGRYELGAIVGNDGSRFTTLSNNPLKHRNSGRSRTALQRNGVGPIGSGVNGGDEVLVIARGLR